MRGSHVGTSDGHIGTAQEARLGKDRDGAHKHSSPAVMAEPMAPTNAAGRDGVWLLTRHSIGGQGRSKQQKGLIICHLSLTVCNGSSSEDASKASHYSTAVL